MADSKVAKARKRLKTIATGISADGLTLDADHIALGNAAAADAFSAPFSYTANQPVLTIGSGAIPFTGLDYPLMVNATLTVPLPAESAQDWANVDNLVAALRAAWMVLASYPVGEVKGRRCDFEPYKAQVRGDLTIVEVTLIMSMDNPDI
jgi:hypothetical protein